MLDTAVDPSWRRTLIIVSAVSFAVHTLVAILSRGPHMADEHFQIIELMSSKLGYTGTSDLAWEYAERMRPWFQPAVYFAIAKLTGIEDPFHLITVLKLCTAWLGFAAMVMVSLCLADWVPDARRRLWALLALHFFVLVPLLHARTSSESFSHAFFAAGIAVMWRWPRLAITAGVLSGLAFAARYQTAFAIAGAGAWGLVRAEQRWRFAIEALVGLAAIAVLATALDRWGYGEWVFAPWENVRANLIDGKSAEHGVQPPWDYVRLSWRHLQKPFGPILILGSVIAWFKLPRHVLTWATIPMLVGHSLIPHKEVRFLFPVAFAMILLVVMIAPVPKWRSLAWVSGAAFAALNVFGYVSMDALGPRLAQYDLLARTYARAPQVEELVVVKESPYWWAGLRMRFLEPRGVPIVELTETASVGPHLAGKRALVIAEPGSIALSRCTELKRSPARALYECQ